MYRLEIDIEVDRWRDLLPTLLERISHLEPFLKGDPFTETRMLSAFGGFSSGGSVVVRVDPTMTPEAFQEALGAFQEALEQKPGAAAADLKSKSGEPAP
jgi:hypothetical protein